MERREMTKRRVTALLLAVLICAPLSLLSCRDESGDGGDKDGGGAARRLTACRRRFRSRSSAKRAMRDFTETTSSIRSLSARGRITSSMRSYAMASRAR